MIKSFTLCHFKKLLQSRGTHQTAYVINPYLRAQEQEKQACYLTKTIKFDGLPPCYQKVTDLETDDRNTDLNTHHKGTNLDTIPKNEKELLVDSIKNSILNTNYFHRDGEMKLPKRWRDERKQRKMDEMKYEMSLKVLLNMLRVVWTSKYAKTAGLLDRNISFRPDLQAPWERLNKKIQISGKHGHLVCGKTLLPLFSTSDEVEKSCDMNLQWDDIISPFFDLHEITSRFESERGFYDGSPFPCPQTLLVMNDPYWFTRMNTGQGVFYSFAHAMTYALSKGAKMGEDLEQPIPMQCLVFNGTSFYFVCYQLNTLNFDDNNNNIKNFTWILPDQYLYEKVHDKLSECSDFTDFTSKRVSLMDYDRTKLTETFENVQSRRVYIEKFHRDTADLFLDFMFYGKSVENC